MTYDERTKLEKELMDNGIFMSDFISSSTYSAVVLMLHKAKQLNRPVVSVKRPYYQLCPKCFGEGSVDNIGNSTSVQRICPVCNGAKTFLLEAVEAAGVCSGEDKTT